MLLHLGNLSTFIKEFSEVCDGTCPPLATSSMEIEILMTLEWRLNIASPFFWLGCYLDLLRTHLAVTQIHGKSGPNLFS